ncbi:hypothetical protein ACFLVR_04215 [Chloroflexota bacterium]
MENKRAHLEMIQNIVNRLSRNSFLLKGWCVVLVSALFALAGGINNIYFVYISYFPLLAFWVLDAYFLHQERLFRKLYDHVREIQEENVDFSMNTSNVKDQTGSWLNVVFSKTLLIFHLTILVSIVAVMTAMIIIN